MSRRDAGRDGDPDAARRPEPAGLSPPAGVRLRGSQAAAGCGGTCPGIFTATFLGAPRFGVIGGKMTPRALPGLRL